MTRVVGIISMMIAATLLIAPIAGSSLGSVWTWFTYRPELAKTPPHFTPAAMLGQPWIGLAAVLITTGVWVWLWRWAFQDGKRAPLGAIGCAILFIALAAIGWQNFTIM
jgi:uncharacterized membrane protein YpjA